MEFARCTQTNSLYSAQQFSGLAPDVLLHRKQNLVCPECDRTAFFRRETQNGRDPCFGARPHAPWCNLKAAHAGTNANDQSDTVAGLMQSGQRIVIDFEYGARQSDSDPSSTRVQGSGARHEQISTPGGHGISPKHLRLGTLLRMLTFSSAFRSSVQIVEVSGIGIFRVADFFVPFESLATMPGGRLLGFFGQIAFAQYKPQDDTLWLNSGTLADPSICVPWEFVPSLFQRFEITEAQALTGANVLVIGLVRTSQYGKKYVLLEDLNQLTIDFVRGQGD